ncbi:molybdopterin molybdenumtransferase MoeA [Porphyrobacter sp. HT-58-2]|uniref:molybdopterin molybdotransferase MoeA n=1 Tax=Porphyrobacter sp. HT-58-2 TaxID=2023229 RepID=UPI000CDBB55B|nr:molybdopterin molybdotransferase MoeA [Porphyrobacter sp. HT-58-2]AUX69995.1 molybdopterin molybdenumtransferase MoeA [Porphyrobacter sp. HT-58-2]
MTGALGLEEAQARLLALAPLLPLEAVPMEAMLGRYLTGDLRAARTQPPADLSAMDGYAVTPGDGPWQIIGESRAGAPFADPLTPGQCIRISTGAVVPQGADRVLLQEDAWHEGATVAASQPAPPGRHIRARGFDFHEGDLLLTRGARMTPGRIALALAGGHAQAMAARRLRVAVMDSGDELAPDPARCLPHQIPASNGAMLAAMLAPLGCEVTRIGPVADDRAALAAALLQAETADVLITSGGASVGDHDLIKPAVAEWGAETAFWKVAIKPGKPLLVATRGAQVILGLPGNPVSSFVTAFLFALPLVRAAMGDPDPLPRAVTMPAGEPLPATGPRREFLRAVNDGGTVRLAGSQDSSALSALAAADCLIDRPAGAAALAAGEPVPVFHLQNG